MIVVSDTSPLNYLILLGHLDIVEVLYQRILVPHAVRSELLHPKAPAAVRTWAETPPSWIELLPAPSTPVKPIAGLQRGETEAIAVAAVLGAAWLFLDDADARDEALRRGLPIIGTLGLLRQGHKVGLVEDLPSTLAALRRSGFRVSQSVIETILASI